MIDALLMLGHTPPPAPVGGRVIRHDSAADDEREPPPEITNAEVEEAIKRILQRGDPRTPKDLADEIGISSPAIPHRIKSLAKRDKRVGYRAEGKFSYAWWRFV